MEEKEIIEQIAALAKKLNEKGTEANSYIRRIEEALMNAGVGAEVWGEQIDEEDFIGYANTDEGWCLVVGSPDPMMPLTRAPRKKKLAAVKYIPDLLQKILEALTADES